jgi:serine/threonine protein kinase
VPPVIDGFTDLVEVGRGGFGTVYRARQVDPARDVAVKVLPDVRADSDAYGRFTREFQALAAVGGHPNIATVHACGVTADGSGYLALELLPGGSLGDRVRTGAAPWVEVAGWGVQLAGALETAHRAGITHRDLKPENVLFDSAGTPKLVDFGIAGVPGAYRTATGSVTLTLAHAAPEVVAGGRGGVPGDVYSLASTLYAALAGSAAFAADTDETLVPMLARIATAPVPDLRPRGVPDPVCTALERGMAKDPVDRPSSAEAFGMMLQSALAAEGRPSAAPLLLLSAGVVAPFVISADAPPPGSTSGAAAPAAVEGDRTLTGWVAPVPAVAAADATHDRRRSGMFAAAASLAAVLALLMVWRGFDTPAPAAAGSSPSTPPSTSASPSSAAPTRTPSPTPSASAPSAAPSPSATPKAGRSLVLTVPAAQQQPSPTRTTKSKPAPSPTPSSSPTTRPTPSPTATPPVTVLRPLAPRRVRAGGALVVRGEAGGPAQVSVALAWTAAKKGAVPTAYEVRWTPVGAGATGVPVLGATVTDTSATVLVPVPANGVRYRWQVRAVLATEGSAWITARVTVPQLVGRRAAQARATLRTLGLGSSTYRVPTQTPATIGRVVEQSLPRGRLVLTGSSLALGIGKAP